MQQPVLQVVPDQQHVDAAIDATPNPSEAAMRGLQAALRAQILALAEGEITSRTMAQLQRFCASAGQALVTLEHPDALVRSRFRNGGVIGSIPTLGSYSMSEDYESDVLASAPPIETYGANASRGIIESAAKIGKDIVQAQAQAQAAARQPTLTDMITSLSIAKNAKVAPDLIKLMEDQIRAKAVEVAGGGGTTLALPQAIPVDPPADTDKKTKTRRKR